MIKAVFFDIGNTLFTYNYEFLSELLSERFDIEVNLEELEATHRIIRTSLGTLMTNGLKHELLVVEAYRKWFRALGIEDEKMLEIIEAVNTHPFKHLFWAKIEDDTRGLINWLSENGYKLGIISNAEGQVKRLVEYAGIASKFTTVLDSHEIGFQKPDERIFLKALRDVKVKADEAVHVGDVFEADVVGARSVGILPILVDRDGHYSHADCITVKKISDLRNLPLFSA